MESVRKNYIYSLIYQLLSMGLPLLTTPYLSRILGPEKIGVYSFTYSIATYFILFAMLGVNNYGNRSCAVVRDNRKKLSETFSEIYVLQCIFACLSISVYVLYIIILSEANTVVAWIQLMVVISALFDVNWLYFGLERFKIVVNRNIAVKLVTVILIFLFVKSPNDIWKYTIIMASSSLFSQIVIWAFLNKHVSFTRPKISKVLLHVKPNLMLFIPVIAVSLYKTMDKIMIGTLSGMTQTGLFDNTEKMINMPLGIITALGTVMLPRMANLVAKNNLEKTKIYLTNSMLFVMFLSVGMTFGIAGIAETFVPLFLGEGFVDCIQLLVYIAPTIIFYSWANVIRTQHLIPNKKDRSYILSVLSGAVINLAVNFLLIPKYGALGAVIGTVAAEATVCIMQTVVVRKEIEIYKFFMNSLPFLVFGFIMYQVIEIIGKLSLGEMLVVFLQILSGTLVYVFLSILFLRFVHKNLFYGVYSSLFRKQM